MVEPVLHAEPPEQVLMPLVYLITESRYLHLDRTNWYHDQIAEEDELIRSAFAEHGIQTMRVDWSDDRVDWAKGKAAIFRTPWDYFERIDEFRDWLASTSKLISFINPYDSILWNFDKHYLLDLQERGFPIVPSIFIERGDKRSLAELSNVTSWQDMIIKPCISGGGYGTYRISADNWAEHEEVYRDLINERDMMVQEFHSSIQSRGEVSLMVLGGQYSHAVLKKAKDQDFRVQDDFGGTVHPYTADQAERELAESVFRSCSPLPAYGRLDVMWTDSGEPMISELEIIEPELWLRERPEAARVMVDHIVRTL